LVENAVRHGFAGRRGGMVEIVARDEGPDCVITIEDDGVGMDPVVLQGREARDGEEATDAGQHVGLSNVDDRLRSVFGDPFGLVVETAPGAGTKVSMRIPKFHPAVRARAA
jgi:two-component system LytT family sensor kinase